MRNRLDSARAFLHKGRFAIIGDVQPTSRWNGASRMPRSACNSSNRSPWRSRTFWRLWETWSSVVPQQRTGPLSTHWLHPCTTHVPVFPLPGNHDYGIVRQAALRHFFTRFHTSRGATGSREPTGRWGSFFSIRTRVGCQWHNGASRSAGISRSFSALSRGLTSAASSSCCTIPLIPIVPWYRTISQSSAPLCRLYAGP